MVTRGRRVVMVTLLALGMAVPGAPSLAQSGAPAAAAPPLEGTDWQLTSLAGAADQSVVPGMGATLALSAGQASGFGGCNQFTTSYLLDGQSLTFATPASSMMACDDTKMSFESVYLGTLPTVGSYAIADDTLTLLDGTGTPALTYASAGVAASAVPGMSSVLLGTWTVTQVNNGNQGVVTVSADPALTVTFAPDGSVAGFGGCNQFGGPFILGGDTIGIGPLHATMMACGDDVDTLEQQLMTALQASTAWSVRDGTLELRDDSGALQVGLSQGVAAPSPA